MSEGQVPAPAAEIKEKQLVSDSSSAPIEAKQRAQQMTTRELEDEVIRLADLIRSCTLAP